MGGEGWWKEEEMNERKKKTLSKRGRGVMTRIENDIREKKEMMCEAEKQRE